MEGRSGEDRSREATVVAGLAIALTVVLHQVRLFRMPQGGSITLGSAIPLWIVARRFGPVWGALSGVGAGVLLFVLGGAPVLHPVQPILDYVLAFGSMGLASLPRSLTGGVALSILVRFTIQVVSGVVFFATYAPSGVNALTYSMVYNSYLVVDMVLALCLLEMLRERSPELVGETQTVAVGRQRRCWLLACAVVVVLALGYALTWRLGGR